MLTRVKLTHLTTASLKHARHRLLRPSLLLAAGVALDQLLLKIIRLEDPKPPLGQPRAARPDQRPGREGRGAGGDGREHHARVEEEPRDHQSVLVVLRKLQPLQALLRLEGAHAHLEVAALHFLEGLGDVLHVARGLDGAEYVLCVEARPVAPVGRDGPGLGPVLDLGQLAEVRDRELGQVVVLVKPLADAVERGEGAEHKGEGGGELEGHVGADAQQRLPEHAAARRALRLGVLLGLVLGPLALAALGVCKVFEEEAGDLLNRHHVRVGVQDPHALRRAQHLLGRVLVDRVILVDAKDELHEPRPKVPADLVHHPKVIVDKAPPGSTVVDPDVAGVGVAVEEAEVGELLEVRDGGALRELGPVETHCFNLLDVGDLG
mmetsp:Transcript_10258/g.26566  ORF Transcript_10258/g.26566 Transcript_10258/m.26566 type:complete len:378 (-) Transcript_10258:1229-2362(-)